ncbi:MAG: TetR/AcrR family transcriptional regulator [Sphaerobacteraceae bacterium]|nr:MAG: TetR/AcrR family transcriptional regulator [Sphaerobacteraceae bacterium]
MRRRLRLSGEAENPGEIRPGGRTARTRESVCRSTLQVLAESGYAELTVERVAERSGVHKSTIYRRWGGIDGLVVDALAFAVDDDWEPDLSGNVEANLMEFARMALASFADPVYGPTHTAVVAAAFQSDRAVDAVHRFFADRFGRTSTIITRAIENGELPKNTDPEAVIRALMAPIYFRLFISRQSVTDVDLEQAVQAALAAAMAGVFENQERR